MLRALPGLPQAQDWLVNVYNGSRREFEKFLAKHRKSGMMTPLEFNGIMTVFQEHTQILMALFAEQLVSLLVSSRISVYMKVSLIIFYVEKNINIIGTNHGGAMGFISLKADNAEADNRRPLNIGHY